MTSIAFAILLTVLPSMNLDRETAKTQIPRVERIARSLHTDSKLANWTIIVLDLGEFQQACPYEVDKFEACSDPKTDVTRVNADWLMWGVSDKKLRHVLAHEAGHLISGSADEDVADRTGATL